MLNVSIKELHDSIAVLKEKQRDIICYIAEQKEQNVDTILTNEVNALKTAIQTMNGVIEGVSNRLTEETSKVTGRVDTFETTVSGLDGRITDVEAIDGRLTAYINTADGRISAVESSIETLSGSLTDTITSTATGIVNDKITELSNTVDGKLTALTGTVDGMIDTQITTFSGTVDTKISTAVEAAKTSVIETVNESIQEEAVELVKLISDQNARIDEIVADIQDGLTEEQLEDVQEKVNASITTLQAGLETVSTKIEALLATLTKEVEDVKKIEDIPIDVTIPEHPPGDQINSIADLGVIMSPSILELRNEIGLVVAKNDGTAMFSVEQIGDKVAVIDQLGKKVNMLVGETVEVNKIQINGTEIAGVDNLLNAGSTGDRIPTSAAVVDYVSKVVALTGTGTRGISEGFINGTGGECADSEGVIDGIPDGMSVSDRSVRSIPEKIVEKIIHETVVEKVDYDVIDQKIDQKVSEKVAVEVSKKVSAEVAEKINILKIDEQINLKVAEKVSSEVDVKLDAKLDAKMDQLKATVQQESKPESNERAVSEPLDAAYIIEPVDGSIKLTSPESKLMINDCAVILDENGPLFLTAQQSYALISSEGNLCILEEDVSGDVAGRFVEYTGTIFTINTNGQTIYAPGVVMTQKLSSATAGVCGKLIADQRYVKNGVINELPTSDKKYVTVVREGYMKIAIESVKNITGDELLLGELLIPGPNGYPTISSVHDAAIKFANKSRVPLMKIVADTVDRCLIIEVV